MLIDSLKLHTLELYLKTLQHLKLRNCSPTWFFDFLDCIISDREIPFLSHILTSFLNWMGPSLGWARHIIRRVTDKLRFLIIVYNNTYDLSAIATQQIGTITYVGWVPLQYFSAYLYRSLTISSCLQETTSYYFELHTRDFEYRSNGQCSYIKGYNSKASTNEFIESS